MDRQKRCKIVRRPLSYVDVLYFFRYAYTVYLNLFRRPKYRAQGHSNSLPAEGLEAVIHKAGMSEEGMNCSLFIMEIRSICDT